MARGGQPAAWCATSCVRLAPMTTHRRPTSCCAGWFRSSPCRDVTLMHKRAGLRQRSRLPPRRRRLQSVLHRGRSPLAPRTPVADPRTLGVIGLTLHRFRDPRATPAAWPAGPLEHPVVLILAGASGCRLLPVHLVRVQQAVGAAYDGG